MESPISPPSSASDFEELLETLRARVAQRRENGEYPEGLEAELEGHFRRLSRQREVPDLTDVREKLDELDKLPGFSVTRIPVDSNVALGSRVHQLIGRAVGRQTQGIFEQVTEFRTVVEQLLAAIVDQLGRPTAHNHDDLIGLVEAVVSRLSEYERAPSGASGPLGELYRRIEALEAANARHGFRPWFDQADFEAEFRGSPDRLREAYRDLAGRFKDCSPVLDFGCGRGEVLDLLLHEVGVEAVGVELDPTLAHQARVSGLPVETGDGLSYLAGLPDNHLGGLVAIQVVEHLTAQEVLELVALARDKVRPGGRVILETVNPMSLYVLGHAFYIDPTHGKLVHPYYLRFLMQRAGFSEVEIDWRSPVTEEDRLVIDQALDDSDPVARENLVRLERLLYGPQDYAVIATR
jgi:SAM-dependent methyltransferase